MKRFFFMSGFLVLLGFSSVTWGAGAQGEDLPFKKKGFFLAGELAGLIGFDEGRALGAPGKLDLLVGYQVNPYFSVAADLWTFWFVAYAAEAQVKVNFIDRKISPYAVGSVGAGVLLNVFDDGGDSTSFLTYSGGLGLDFHLWKKGTIFTEGKYRGSQVFNHGDFLSTGHGMEFGVGYRHLF